jgi:hypothetical protein
MKRNKMLTLRDALVSYAMTAIAAQELKPDIRKLSASKSCEDKGKSNRNFNSLNVTKNCLCSK